MLKNSVPPSKKTHYIAIVKTSRWMLCMEIIAVYSEDRTKHQYTLWGKCICLSVKRDVK